MRELADVFAAPGGRADRAGQSCRAAYVSASGFKRQYYERGIGVGCMLSADPRLL